MRWGGGAEINIRREIAPICSPAMGVFIQSRGHNQPIK